MTSLLTAFIFILTTINSSTTIKLTTNHASFKNLIEQIKDTLLTKIRSLDKTPYPLTSHILYGLLLDRKLSITFNRSLKVHSTLNPTILDITPYRFLHNKYTTLLLHTPVPIQTNALLKQTFTIINNLRWHNQQRITLWDQILNNINWDMSQQYLSYNDKPKALYTHPSLSNLKNFKVKLIAEELPTQLLLHLRNLHKNPNHLCPRCQAAPEDIIHTLTCISNPFSLCTKLNSILKEVAEKYKLQYEIPNNFIQTYIDLHITKAVPISIITTSTTIPLSSNRLKQKYTPVLHHHITEFIYQEIWLPSRAAQHSGILPPPTPIPLPVLTPTKPLTQSFISQKLYSYISRNTTSLHNLLEN